MSDERIYRATIYPNDFMLTFGDDEFWNIPSVCACEVEPKVAELKNLKLRVYELQDGDIVYLSASDRKYNVGDKYDGNEHLIISKVVRYKRPWWKFWVKRKVVGYESRYER